MPRSVITQNAQGNIGRRNIIINPKMEIDQRHSFNAHNITDGSDFFADRWGFYSNSAAVNEYTAQTQVVDDGPEGFLKSLKWTTLSVTGNGIPATSEVIFRQPIEGYNIQQVDYGTPLAKDLTLSFYVKASIAGNYGLQCQFEDTTNTQNYIQRSYTVTTANVWERVQVSIPANPAKVMKHKTTGAGLRINWDFGEGATYSTAASNSWTTTYTNGLAGGVKLAENNGATWQITGCQLELGNTMTDFEHRSIAEEMTLCQRYLHSVRGGIQGWCSSTNGTCYWTVHLKPQMRVTPSVSCDRTSYRYGDVVSIGITMTNINVVTNAYSTADAQIWYVTGTNSATPVQYRNQLLEPQNDTHGRFLLQAEI